MTDISDYAVEIIGGLFVLAVGSAFAWKSWPHFWRYTKARDLPPAEGTHFTILVAELEDDTTDRKQTKHVLSSLRSQFSAQAELRAFEVRDFPKSLRSGIAGNLADTDRAAEQIGRDWLQAQNADLLIWGEVAEVNKVIRLRFLPRKGQASQQQSYAFTNLLELPFEFKAELGEVLTIVALSAAMPAFSATNSLIKLLLPIIPRLKNIVDYGRRDLSAECYGSICNSAATAFLVFGDQSGQSIWVDESEKAFSKVIDIFTLAEYPEQWAMAQMNLGVYFAMRGQTNNGATSREWLKKSVVAFENALSVLTQSGSPLEWARIQSNLSNAYRMLAVLIVGDDTGDLFQKSILASNNALKVHTKEAMPFDWAVCHLNLSIAFHDIGKRSVGPLSQDYLEQSLLATEAALEILTFENFPLQWAMAKSCLGATSGIFGERGNGEAALKLLHISVSAFGDALKVYTPKEFPAYRAMNQVNLANAMRVLGDRTQDRTAFAKAINAYKEALVFYNQPGKEVVEAKTREQLALAEAEMLKTQ